MAVKSILVIHGPNLNLLGAREPEHYGHATLGSINAHLSAAAKTAGVVLEAYQSNAEADIVAKIHTLATEKVDFIIINPAAFTHTSVSIRDAISAVNIPFIEVHLSNVFTRESFRHHSYFSDIAVGVISGLGADGYDAALRFAINQLNTEL
ncbi:MAG TPA: type II 3-dehydroquinate dehydratase [Methylophilaceae bacterium]|jgi:3-dehydroquinate dehydratase-2|nr:type II 3-dehydroquinate dehydratase [Methylophilaceae bacterium]